MKGKSGNKTPPKKPNSPKEDDTSKSPKNEAKNAKLNEDEEIKSPESIFLEKHRPFNFVQSYLTQKLNKESFKPDISKGTKKGLNDRLKIVLDLINHGEAKFSKDQKTVKAIIEKYESKKKKDNVDEEMRKQIIKEAKGNKESLENKIRSLEANIQLLENNDLLHNTSKLDNSTIQKEVVDENIRNSRIKEIKHTKNLLEKKLKTIDNHIDGLINEENLNSKKKLDIKKFLDNFEADKVKTEKQVKKWEKDNVDRGQRIKDNQLNQEKKIKEITEKQIEKVKFETEKKRTLAKQREDELNSKNKAKRKVLENERNDWKVKVEDLKVQIKEAPYKIDIPKLTNAKLSTNELKYIYELKEEKFNEEKKKLEEEKVVHIKTELLNKKKFFKPIQREELDEFKKKTDDLKQELIFKLERDRAVIQEDIDSKNQNLPKPETQYYMKAMQQDKEQKENIEKQRLERIYKQMKLKNFAKAVKENIVPTLNEDLKAKAELKKDQLLNPKLYIEHHHTKKKPRVILKKADPKNPHLYGKKDGKWRVDLNKSINSLKRSNSHTKSLRSNTALSRGKDYSKDEKSFAQLNKTSNSAKYSRSRSARKNKKKKKQALPKPPDYLTEMRIKKHNEERSMSRESKKKDLKTLMKDDDKRWEKMINRNKYSLLENVEQIKMKAKKLEEQAKRKEQLILLNGGPEKNQKLGEDVSNMLIDAIRAKLTILDNISKK